MKSLESFPDSTDQIDKEEVFNEQVDLPSLEIVLRISLIWCGCLRIKNMRKEIREYALKTVNFYHDHARVIHRYG